MLGNTPKPVLAINNMAEVSDRKQEIAA